MNDADAVRRQAGPVRGSFQKDGGKRRAQLLTANLTAFDIIAYDGDFFTGAGYVP